MISANQSCMTRLSILVLLILSTWCSVSTVADEWPGWRGVERQGRSASENIPLEWSETENVRWHVPLPGKGHSSPVVSEDRVYVTTAYISGRGLILKQMLTGCVFCLWGVVAGIVMVSMKRWLRSHPSPGYRNLVPGFVLCLLAGLLLYSLLEVHLAYGTDRKALYFCWIHSAAGIGFCILLASAGLSSRSARLGAGIGLLVFTIVVLLGPVQQRGNVMRRVLVVVAPERRQFSDAVVEHPTA